jgi:hypothetical protein
MFLHLLLLLWQIGISFFFLDLPSLEMSLQLSFIVELSFVDEQNVRPLFLVFLVLLLLSLWLES